MNSWIRKNLLLLAIGATVELVTGKANTIQPPAKASENSVYTLTLDIQGALDLQSESPSDISNKVQMLREVVRDQIKLGNFDRASTALSFLPLELYQRNFVQDATDLLHEFIVDPQSLSNKNAGSSLLRAIKYANSADWVIESFANIQDLASLKEAYENYYGILQSVRPGAANDDDASENISDGIMTLNQSYATALRQLGQFRESEEVLNLAISIFSGQSFATEREMSDIFADLALTQLLSGKLYEAKNSSDKAIEIAQTDIRSPSRDEYAAPISITANIISLSIGFFLEGKPDFGLSTLVRLREALAAHHSSRAEVATARLLVEEGTLRACNGESFDQQFSTAKQILYKTNTFTALPSFLNRFATLLARQGRARDAAESVTQAAANWAEGEIPTDDAVLEKYRLPPFAAYRSFVEKPQLTAQYKLFWYMLISDPSSLDNLSFVSKWHPSELYPEERRTFYTIIQAAYLSRIGQTERALSLLRTVMQLPPGGRPHVPNETFYVSVAAHLIAEIQRRNGETEEAFRTLTDQWESNVYGTDPPLSSQALLLHPKIIAGFPAVASIIPWEINGEVELKDNSAFFISVEDQISLFLKLVHSKRNTPDPTIELSVKQRAFRAAQLLIEQWTANAARRTAIRKGLANPGLKDAFWELDEAYRIPNDFGNVGARRRLAEAKSDQESQLWSFAKRKPLQGYIACDPEAKTVWRLLHNPPIRPRLAVDYHRSAWHGSWRGDGKKWSQAIDRINEFSRAVGIPIDRESLYDNRHSISQEDVARNLRPGEAVITIVPTSFGTYVAVVDSKWSLTSMMSKLTADEISAINVEIYKSLRSGEASNALIPYPIGKAYRVYKDLFEPVAGSLADTRKLFIVASGEASRLPFNALVTDPAGPRWLSEKFQMVMLPSPLSLGPPLGQKAMNADGNRQFPFVGFGSPLLRKAGSPSLGKPNDCAEGLGFPRPNRGLADVDALRRLCELTDEEDMLFWLAKAFNVDKDSSLSLWVGPRASVTNIKNMASNIFLKDVAVLAFATHGLNATDVLAASGTEEPGLVLTPPAKATSSDDGLLSASEISKLDISADLVLLIACDSALGDRLNTEALTGLTRAFFSAGAKKILVSQFPVDVVATRSLMKSFAESISSGSFDPDMAINQAMKEMREGRDAVYVHPRYWAGFMLVMSSR